MNPTCLMTTTRPLRSASDQRWPASVVPDSDGANLRCPAGNSVMPTVMTADPSGAAAWPPRSRPAPAQPSAAATTASNATSPVAPQTISRARGRFTEISLRSTPRY